MADFLLNKQQMTVSSNKLKTVICIFDPASAAGDMESILRYNPTKHCRTRQAVSPGRKEFPACPAHSWCKSFCAFQGFRPAGSGLNPCPPSNPAGVGILPKILHFLKFSIDKIPHMCYFVFQNILYVVFIMNRGE